MKTVFRGEGNSVKHGSSLIDAYLPTPPEDGGGLARWTSNTSSNGSNGRSMAAAPIGAQVIAWAEIWDYEGGTSFRAFIADDDTDKSLFVFFDAGVMGRELKQA
jgi:hypothetical protein